MKPVPKPQTHEKYELLIDTAAAAGPGRSTSASERSDRRDVVQSRAPDFPMRKGKRSCKRTFQRKDSIMRRRRAP